ncbi:cytochrome o ubiquinol oxidase subunit IV [Pokkaliibacter sp. CJK22405]|uniref:cytochrome o ubiquinol oxidase subunit IV n=1 Tax=Pokkaliibacter sp. CJK22405 TaxID=3384615 RepID=UPI0039850DDB
MSNHSNHTAAGESHGSFKSYLNGFILSIVLTIVPFVLVMYPSLATPATALAVMLILGIAQILVQLICFLHMGSSEASWNNMAFIFTLLIVAILIGGTVWIMYNMTINMML